MCMLINGPSSTQDRRPFGWNTTILHRRRSAKTPSPRSPCARLHASHRRTARCTPHRRTDTANSKAVRFPPPLGLERRSRADSARNCSLLLHCGSTRSKGKGLVCGSNRREPRGIGASLDHRCTHQKLEAVRAVLDLSLDAGDIAPRGRVMGTQRGGEVTSRF